MSLDRAEDSWLAAPELTRDEARKSDALNMFQEDVCYHANHIRRLVINLGIDDRAGLKELSRAAGELASIVDDFNFEPY